MVAPPIQHSYLPTRLRSYTPIILLFDDDDDDLCITLRKSLFECGGVGTLARLTS